MSKMERLRHNPAIHTVHVAGFLDRTLKTALVGDERARLVTFDQALEIYLEQFAEENADF